MQHQSQLAELEARLADLEARVPAHSMSPSMLMEIEELECEIARLRARGGEADAKGIS